jgi:hypothetical protein
MSTALKPSCAVTAERRFVVPMNGGKKFVGIAGSLLDRVDRHIVGWTGQRRR